MWLHAGVVECADQIFAVRQVCKKYLTKGKDVFRISYATISVNVFSHKTLNETSY